MNVELVDYMGSDLTVVNSARVSFNKHKEEMDDLDVKLIKYLAKHKHITPFQHPQITLRMQAPVPIRTQLFKHKVGLTENEESRRYVKSTPPLFIPECFRSAPEGSIKQGSAGEHPRSTHWKDIYEARARTSIKLYEEMIEDGVAPEQARFILPQGVEVQWYWTGSLAAFARVYWQRYDSHAQKEVQQIAKMIDEIIKPLYPVSWDALTNQ